MERDDRGRWGWRAPAVLFVVAFAIYALTITHSQISFDVYGANYTTWRLVSTGSPWIEGVHIPALAGHTMQGVAIVQTANGHTAFGRFPGVVVAGIPAYALAHAAHMTIIPGGLSAAFITAGSVTLMFAALRRHLELRSALLAACVFGFATPVWSVAANGVWPHTITLLGIAGMAWASTTGRWWWVGIFGGVALWGRLHAALIVAVLGLAVSWRRRDLGILLRVGTASGAFVLLMSVWTRWMYGTWNPMGAYNSSGVLQGTHQYSFDVVNQLGMWVAPDRGILVWTPVVLLLLPALVRSWRDLPDWSRSLLWGGVVYTVVECAINTFTGGDLFYGYRYGLEFLACATPALALAAPRMGTLAGRLVGPVLGVQLLAIAVGSINDSVFLPERDVWRNNTFVHFINDAGAPGWALVLVFAALGAVGAHLWSRAGRLEREPVPASHS